MINNIPCKHVFLIFINVFGWVWNALPESYLQSSYLTCDNDMVDMIGECTNIENFVDISHHTDLLMYIENQLPVKVKYIYVFVECTYTTRETCHVISVIFLRIGTFTTYCLTKD